MHALLREEGVRPPRRLFKLYVIVLISLFWFISNLVCSGINCGGWIFAFLLSFGWAVFIMEMMLAAYNMYQLRFPWEVTSAEELWLEVLALSLLMGAYVTFLLFFGSFHPYITSSWILATFSFVMSVGSFLELVVWTLMSLCFLKSRAKIDQMRYFRKCSFVCGLCISPLSISVFGPYFSPLLFACFISLSFGSMVATFAVVLVFGCQLSRRKLITTVICIIAGIILTIFAAQSGQGVQPLELIPEMFLADWIPDVDPPDPLETKSPFLIFSICPVNPKVQWFYDCNTVGTKVLKSRRVNVARWVHGSMSTFAKDLWGHSLHDAPLHGRVFLPLGSGPFPVVFISHGNTAKLIPSYKGFDYLLSSLAKNGVIAVSLGHEFVNSGLVDMFEAAAGASLLTQTEDHLCRAVLMMEAMQQLRDWSKSPAHPLFGKISPNVAFVGHGEAGRSALLTSWLSKLSEYSNGSSPTFSVKFDFNVKLVVNMGGQPIYDPSIDALLSNIPLSGVDVLLLQGTHDGNTPPMLASSFLATTHCPNFKALFTVFSANHAQFNQLWEYSSDRSLDYFAVDGTIQPHVMETSLQQWTTATLVTSASLISLRAKLEYIGVLQDFGWFYSHWHPLSVGKLAVFRSVFKPNDVALLNLTFSPTTPSSVDCLSSKNSYACTLTLPDHPLNVFDLIKQNATIAAPLSTTLIFRGNHIAITLALLYQSGDYPKLSQVIGPQPGVVTLHIRESEGGGKILVTSKRLQTSIPVYLAKNEVEFRNAFHTLTFSIGSLTRPMKVREFIFTVSRDETTDPTGAPLRYVAFLQLHIP